MNRMLGFKNDQKATGINKLCQAHFQTRVEEFVLISVHVTLSVKRRAQIPWGKLSDVQVFENKKTDRQLPDSQGNGKP